MSDSCLQHTHLKKNFLLGILYDIINTTFLHYNQIKQVDSEIEDLGLKGWQSFPNFYLGKKMLLGEVSHAPYELKRVRYNKDLFPATHSFRVPNEPWDPGTDVFPMPIIYYGIILIISIIVAVVFFIWVRKSKKSKLQNIH